ncbi:MAG: tetratricopeptide repeat protein [Pseudomonadota bacterium]
MKLNLKSISIILMLQIITGLAVFMLTRAYYMDEASLAKGTTASSAMGQTELSTDELINSLQNYPQLNPSSDPMEIDTLANEAFQRGDYAKAAKLYQRVIDLAPLKVEPHNNLGLTLHYLGRSAEALEILNHGTELDPSFQRIWLTLGFVQSSVGNAQEARQALERTVELGADTEPGKSASEMLGKLP